VPGALYLFGAFSLDAQLRRLSRDGERVPLGDRQAGVLACLVEHAGKVVSKDDLISAAWNDVAVTDNSLEQAISALRRLLGEAAPGQPYVETVPRRGYRFAGAVTRTTRRESDDSLDALLAPHRAWVEGRAALETLRADRVAGARVDFEQAVAAAPDLAVAHIGLANACVMQFEMTRADASPNVAALTTAVEHARDACRLDAQSAEAWATLGFVLDRIGRHDEALAACGRATMLEPDNWRHHFRLALVGWGEQRLRAARRTLALVPGFPLAHWLAATVLVARGALEEAERELEAGIAPHALHRVLQNAPPLEPTSDPPRFGAVALHWLRGLLLLAQGEEQAALDSFARELALEQAGQLYARECCANASYAIGATKLRAGDAPGARAAFQEALDRVGAHPMARVGVALVAGGAASLEPGTSPVSAAGEARERLSDHVETARGAFDVALARAVQLVATSAHHEAARLVDAALASADAASAGWILPVEPLLRVGKHADAWAPVLARLRSRAS
jgi:DNA-binding winged helix-turn-helix (wHTH) protein